ncbi:MAG TPA: plastocyanin/azurin family copper-binding protein [Gemmatimonadaceae bacterium]|nr:plastocyanin/azurin family copper-binding protein [Gemmatimonadaceae bacterium]
MQFKVLAVATSAFALAACGGGEKKAEDTAAAAAAAPAAAAPAAGAPAAAGAMAAMPITGETKTVNMIGDEKGYRFEPAEITVKAGDGIKFVSVKGGPHNVAFDPATAGASAAQITANMPEASGDLTGKMLVTDGEAYTMSFAGVAPGSYTVICTPHQAMNMLMKVVVQ